jgi:hypothetical protein
LPVPSCWWPAAVDAAAPPNRKRLSPGSRRPLGRGPTRFALSSSSTAHAVSAFTPRATSTWPAWRTLAATTELPRAPSPAPYQRARAARPRLVRPRGSYRRPLLSSTMLSKWRTMRPTVRRVPRATAGLQSCRSRATSPTSSPTTPHPFGHSRGAARSTHARPASRAWRTRRTRQSRGTRRAHRRRPRRRGRAGLQPPRRGRTRPRCRRP